MLAVGGQASVALSSCEAEVTAASEGIKEALQCGTRILSSTRCWTHETHRFENLVSSRLDCCERYEIEEDTENTKTWQTCRRNTPSAKELEAFLPLMSLRSCSE